MKIGRFDPRSAAFTEFSLPTADATPIGITLGADGNLWFAQKRANKIGRITSSGVLAEFTVPTEKAGPDGIALGPDGNVWFSETEVSQIGRITPDGKITEFKSGITPGSKPLSIVVRDGALWFSEAAGNRVGRITVDGTVSEIRHPEPRQPAARDGHPSRWQHLVCRNRRQCSTPPRPRWHIRGIYHPDTECILAWRNRRRRRQSVVYRKLRQQDRVHGPGWSIDR